MLGLAANFIAFFPIYYFTGEPSVFFIFFLEAILSVLIIANFIFFFIKPKTRVLKILSASFLAFAFFGSLASAGTSKLIFDDYTHFTVKKWNAYDEKYRFYLAESFTEKIDLNNDKVADIKAQLGEPSMEISDKIYYDLGYPVRQFNIDPFFLIITFDTNQTITSYSIMES